MDDSSSACQWTTSHLTSDQELQTSENIVDSTGRHYSMSTKINANTVLSHDHFPSGFPYGYKMSTLSIAEGGGYPLAAYNGNDYPFGGTSLISVNGTLPGVVAPIASQETIASITSGDSVDVVYWDDSSSKPAVGTFTVSEIHLGKLPGTAYINLNSGGTINGGDSGSGIFYHGQLIGNLSNVTYSFQDVFGETFPSSSQGELIPSYINQSSVATTPVQ